MPYVKEIVEIEMVFPGNRVANIEQNMACEFLVVSRRVLKHHVTWIRLQLATMESILVSLRFGATIGNVHLKLEH